MIKDGDRLTKLVENMASMRHIDFVQAFVIAMVHLGYRKA